MYYYYYTLTKREEEIPVLAGSVVINAKKK